MAEAPNPTPGSRSVRPDAVIRGSQGLSTQPLVPVLCVLYSTLHYTTPVHLLLTATDYDEPATTFFTSRFFSLHLGLLGTVPSAAVAAVAAAATAAAAASFSRRVGWGRSGGVGSGVRACAACSVASPWMHGYGSPAARASLTSSRTPARGATDACYGYTHCGAGFLVPTLSVHCTCTRGGLHALPPAAHGVGCEPPRPQPRACLAMHPACRTSPPPSVFQPSATTPFSSGLPSSPSLMHL